MENKERYGRFVLQLEEARISAGSLFRAVQLGASGYERHVQLFRSESLGAPLIQAVEEGLKQGLVVHHPQAARGFEVGRIDRTVFASFELFEGRSVGALMARSQAERHPFAPDHALLIASKTAAALEAAQARKTFHGFLLPEFIHVSHDGEVSVRCFGLPPRALRDANRVGGREAVFLAPEVGGAGALDVRADVFSLGAQLFEMLVGSALPRAAATAKSIEAARIPTPGGDGSPLPKALAALLGQALAENPEQRFKDATAFKKAVDTLLFSGDYSPTTFNLAFFMHTLFRDEGDEDAALIKAERLADYRPFLAAPAADPSAPRTQGPPPAPPAARGASSPPPSRSPDASLEAIVAEAAKSDPTRHDSGRISRLHPAARSPVADHLFETAMAPEKSFPKAPLVIGVLAVIGTLGYFMTRQTPPSPPASPSSPAMSPAEAAALARVRELESQLADLEAEKAAAEQKAADEARMAVEARAKARGRVVDPLELQKAEDEARRRAQAEQEERLQIERQKIEDERRAADEARAAEAARVAALTPTATPSIATPPPTPSPSAATPTPTPEPSPSPAPASTPSGPVLLDLEAPGVTPPQLISQPRIVYPPLAREQRVTGRVLVSALVDEQGNVEEVKLVRGVTSRSGLNEAALENVRGRKYKPATLNGKPGKAWVAVLIDFKL